MHLVSDKTLENALKETSELVDDTLKDLLPELDRGSVGEKRLAEAMHYSVLSAGKRLRPFLVVKSADLFGVSRSSSLQTAAAIELIHAYSLIHDDLPALDDDDMRRGKPSCHKQFDEATAILAGDALLTLAFEVVSHPSTHESNSVRAELCRSIAEACGIRGMIGGQMTDIISEDRKLHIEEITRLQRMKTGALFAISCEAGAILGKAAPPMRKALRAYAYDVGLSFQITDDLLDAESGDSELWSTERQNKSIDKGTYVSALGADKAKRQAEILSAQAQEHLKTFGKQADLLNELARFVVERKK